MVNLKVYTGNKYANNLTYLFLVLSIIWFFFFIDTEIKQLTYVGYLFILLFIVFLLINFLTQKKSDLIISYDMITHISNKIVLQYQIQDIKNIEVMYGSYFGKFRPNTFTFSGGMGNLLSFISYDKKIIFEFKLTHSDIKDLNMILNHWRNMNINFVLTDDSHNPIASIPLPY